MMRAISRASLAASIFFLAACGGGGSGNNDGGSAQPSGTGATSGTPAGNPETGAGNPVTSASHAYIVQAATNASSMTADTIYTGGSLLKCSIDANGMLSECGASGAPTLNNPLTIAFSGSTAYIVNQTAPDLEGGTGRGGQYRVLRCTVEANGSLAGCTDTLPGGSIENEFAFKLIASSDGNGFVLKERQLLNCPNDFSSKCGTDPNSQIFPAGVIASDINFVDNRLYVVNAGSSSSAASILSFDVDPATGMRSATSKTVTDASFNEALRFDADVVDTPSEIAIQGENAYILTRYGNWVVQCSYNRTANTMTACTRTTPLASLPGITPRHLAVQGSYAYITDSSRTADENSIVKCTIGATDGKFGSCAVVSGPSITTQIADIELR